SKMSDIASETHVQRNKIAAKPGRKPKEVWKFFTPIGQKKDGHQSCKCNYCPWSQTHGEPSSMEAHLALSCHKAPIDIKEKFLLIIKSRAGEELREKITNEISGGRLKNYVVTRWTTAWDCTNSILRLEQTLKNILDETPEKLSAEVTKLIQSRSFFIDVEAVNTLLGPVKSVVKSLAFKTTLLSDCLLPTVFRNIYLLAIKIWVNMGGGETSSAKLISQIRSFYLRDIEFDYPFSNNEDVITWWRMCNPVPDEENHIQKLALKILFITPHNARCERVFSILGWFTNKRRTKLKVEKLEAMAKLHIHYIMNA
ncbi:5422_t:CDS:2, partial [Rhizophagus irregularis]